MAGVLASQGKPSHVQLASLMSAGSKLGCSTPDQLTTDAPGKAVKGGRGAWATAPT